MRTIGSCLCAWMLASPCFAEHRLAHFSADVTPPIGHPCMGGGIAVVARIDDPLFANGFVLLGAGRPIVVVAVDWCEIRNDAYEHWRKVLSAAADTSPERVLVAALHQHDAPIADLEAQRILDRAGAKGRICDLAFHQAAVERVAKALKASLPSARRVTHLGTGQQRVEKVASNRRFLAADGTPRHSRMSSTRDPFVRDAPEGVVDPRLKTLSFWDGDQPILALSVYATHPMSYYGRGGVSSDFVGLARKRRQTDEPNVVQLYASGCSGNVTAGKYNDGATENRAILADRIHQAMKGAWKATIKTPLQSVAFRNEKLRLEPRESRGFTVAELEESVKRSERPFGQCLAAMGLSWRKRLTVEPAIDVPAIDFGSAVLLLLPAESYVEYQLMAQQTRPNDFVVVLGYGECAPGYIPMEQAVKENDPNLHDWNWVAPGSEARMRAAIEAVLRKPGK